MTARKTPTPTQPVREITPSYRTSEMHFDNQWRTTFRFFWFCAGADHHELEQPACSTDRNRYAGLGAFVFLTAIMAGVSAGYALSFVFHSLVAAPIGGLLWAVMIFSFDRFMVQSIRKSR